MGAAEVADILGDLTADRLHQVRGGFPGADPGADVHPDLGLHIGQDLLGHRGAIALLRVPDQVHQVAGHGFSA